MRTVSLNDASQDRTLMSQPKPWKRSSCLLSPSRSRLVVVDVQERLLPSIEHGTQILQSLRFLLDAARILNVRTIVTEQYPKGLGPTVAEIATHAAITSRLEKLRFSAAEVLTDAGELERTDAADPPQIVLAGIETHICVQQTAADLIAQGCCVFLALDASGSRHAIDAQTAVHRMQTSGVVITTVESIAFEWCEVAGSDQFKALSRLVKDRVR